MTTPPGDDRKSDDGWRYPEAMAELEAIVAGLERDDLDVDELGTKVARAAELIRWCRARVHHARMEVEQIVVDLDSDGRTP
ncbi:MAG: exodeoxyribonuclease VII small subunit [Acidimicrobiales bacterium]